MERSILLYGTSARDAEMVIRVLGHAQIAAMHCHHAAGLQAMLAQGVGALLLPEEALSLEAAEVLTAFVDRQPPWSDLPVLLLAKHGATSWESQRAFERLGNVTLLERPLRTLALVSAVRSALRARGRQYEMRLLNQRKDEFLAALAHELRNPLAPIKNSVAVLQREPGTPQSARLLGIVDRQVSHLRRLVDDLLDVARITNGKLELQRERTTVQSVVEDATELAREVIDTRSHQLQVVLPPQGGMLQADHVRLVQCVSNLLINAAKFTPPRGRIALEVHLAAPWVTFTVRDNGVGIEPALLDTLFNIFTQARTAGETGSGLGLGLHLTRAFAELHGGEVKATSDGLGRGAAFTLRLPVVVRDI